MNNRGVTLIELLIVISIIVILAVAVGFSFQGWMGGYKVESQIKQIYVDLMNARTRAMTTNNRYLVDFPTATTYRVSIDDSDGTVKVDGGDGVLQPQSDPTVPTADTDTTQTAFPKTLEYPVTWGSGVIQFDNRGNITASGSSPWVLSVSTANDADYDCISVTESKIHMGKMSGGICVAK